MKSLGRSRKQLIETRTSIVETAGTLCQPIIERSSARRPPGLQRVAQVASSCQRLPGKDADMVTNWAPVCRRTVLAGSTLVGRCRRRRSAHRQPGCVISPLLRSPPSWSRG